MWNLIGGGGRQYVSGQGIEGCKVACEADANCVGYESSDSTGAGGNQCYWYKKDGSSPWPTLRPSIQAPVYGTTGYCYRKRRSWEGSWYRVNVTPRLRLPSAGVQAPSCCKCWRGSPTDQRGPPIGDFPAERWRSTTTHGLLFTGHLRHPTRDCRLSRCATMIQPSAGLWPGNCFGQRARLANGRLARWAGLSIRLRTWKTPVHAYAITRPWHPDMLSGWRERRATSRLRGSMTTGRAPAQGGHYGPCSAVGRCALWHRSNGVGLGGLCSRAGLGTSTQSGTYFRPFTTAGRRRGWAPSADGQWQLQAALPLGGRRRGHGRRRLYGGTTLDDAYRHVNVALAVASAVTARRLRLSPRSTCHPSNATSLTRSR